MTDIASLGISVDSRDVKKGKEALDGLTASGGKAEDATKRLAVANNALADAARFVVKAYTALKILQYVKDATLLNARYETLGVSMRVVGQNAGYTAAQMEEAALGLQKTGITMVESRQQILRLVQAQIDLGDASKLARIAQNAAVIANVNSSEAFARLIHGIQSGQTEVLKMLGINVSMERSYKEMAKSLGVTTDQLTQQQRTQGVLNSVMREGEMIAGIYEAAMGTAGKQLASMQRYTENLKLTLGETFNEALVIAVEAATFGLKGMNEQAKDLAVNGQLRQWGRDAIMIAAHVIDAFRLVKNVFVQAADGIMFLAEAAKLAVKGEFGAIRELSAAQEKKNAEFVKEITLVSDLAQQRFALIDRERANADAIGETTKKTVKHTESVENDAKALKKAEDAYQNLIQSIREKIAVQQLEIEVGKSLTDAQKTALDIMVQIRDGELKLNDAKKQELVSELERLALAEDINESMKFSKQVGDDLIESGQQQVNSIQEQVTAMRDQNSLIGQSSGKSAELAAAKNMELATNLRLAAAYAGPLHNAYIVHANDLQKIALLQMELAKEENIAEAAAEWSRIGQTIESSGKTAFIQFAAHGTDAMSAIGKAIKTSIIDLLYQLTVRKWMINIGTTVQGSLLSGAASAAGGGAGGGGVGVGTLLNAGSSIFSAISGSLTGGMSSAVMGLGSMFGSSAVSAFGAGMGMSASAGAAAAGELAAAGLGSMGSAVSMGSMMSAMAGPLAVAAIVDMGLRMLAGNRVVGGGVGKVLNYVPVIGPLINAIFGAGPKKLGPAELSGEFTAEGFSGQFEADWKRKVGLFGGKKRGRRGLGIQPEQLEVINKMMFGITDSINEFVEFTGDAQRSLSGWSFSIRKQIETEEQQAELSLELANSIAEKLIPELVVLQAEGETLVETLGRVRAEFILTDQIIDMTGQTFGAAGIASLGLRDSLVQLMGGLQNAGGLLQPFFENFYTDAERAASTGRLINIELERLGITSMPASREQFRALVEAQDLSTLAGQEMFVALLSLAPAFATVTDAIGQSVSDMEAEAKRIADSFKLLGTESFATLFEYTKYIQMAANAGVTAAQPDPIFQDGQTKLPSFAAGADFLPRDMTANLHAGERIIPAADNSAIIKRLSGSDDGMKAVLSELKKLREENKAHALALAKNTSRTAKILDAWDGNGIPEERLA